MLSKDERLDFVSLLSRHKLIPVATFPDALSALKVAELLMHHAISALEITLRNTVALECVTAVRREFPGMYVGVGSVLGIRSLESAADAGADFCVAPCFNRDVLEAAISAGMDFMPGIATPSELSAALGAGARAIKIFPAAHLGGPSYLASLVQPFVMMEFGLVPTGGVTENNFAGYMEAERVIACGASSVVDTRLVEEKKYEELSAKMKAYASVCRSLDGNNSPPVP